MKTAAARLDMLHGPIWNKLPRFALPVAATAILEQLFNASDVAIVGNFTAASERTAAVAAVGANSAIIGLVVNLFIGIALGANVVIANAIGAGRPQEVQKAVHTSVLVSVLGGVLVALVGQLVAAPLLSLLNVPADVLPLALLYLRIYLAGMPVILLYNFQAAIFRSVGETKIPLMALATSGVLNVLLNLFFVAVLHRSVDGVAIATVISNAVSALLLFRRLCRTDREIRLDPRQLRIDGAVLRRILRIGLPAGVQSAVFALSNIVVQAAINSLGTVVMAASSAAFNIEIITYDILNSFSQACTTFVGQNYGARQIDRCKRTFWLSLAEGAVALAIAIVLILSFGRPLLSLFNRDPEVIATGYVRLPAGLRHLPGSGGADHAGRVRRTHRLDPLRVPHQPQLSHHHDRLPREPVHHRSAGAGRAAGVPPLPPLCRQSSLKQEKAPARGGCFFINKLNLSLHGRTEPSTPTTHP